MTRNLLPRFATLILALGLLSGQARAQSGPGAAGHWEGAITLPSIELAILVDLRQTDGKWAGVINIPVQLIRNLELGAVTVSGADVSFKLPGIPGDPIFLGKLSDGGQVLAGDFKQAGQTLPFKLARKAKEVDPAATPDKGIPGQGFAGIWQGSLKVQITELRLVFKLKGPEDKLTGTLDSIDQNSKGLPLTTARVDGNKLHLEFATIQAAYDGVLSEDGSEIAGTWRQGPGKQPLVIKRLAKAPDVSRPQDPKPPYPYQEEEVAFENPEAGIKLAGTLTLPKGRGPHPAVVLITGSGAQDRDESLAGHRPFLVLADHLARQGIAVLRCDDRGMGGSGGDFGKALNADFVSDTIASVAYLKQRREIDPKRIGLVGHSEGGITAPRVASRSGDVAFVVLMAGVGVPMEELLVRQAVDVMRVMGVGDEVIQSEQAVQQEIFKALRESQSAGERETRVRAIVERKLSSLTDLERKASNANQIAESQLRMVLSPWYLDILDYDPRPALEKVTCPVLAINGAKDVQVASRDNLSAIERAVRHGGNTDVTTIELPGLNHLFQTCDTGSMSEYQTIEETINPKALQTISDWVRKHAGL